LTHTFKAKEELSAVRLFVTLNRTDGEAPFHLMTSFPKKVFTEDDYSKPLDALGIFETKISPLIFLANNIYFFPGLVPTAVIIVSKAQ
jgi:UBX domain